MYNRLSIVTNKLRFSCILLVGRTVLSGASGWKGAMFATYQLIGLAGNFCVDVS